MKKIKNRFILTDKEIRDIYSSLLTLEATGGTTDPHYNKDCNKAGVLAKKISKIIKDDDNR